MSKFFLTVIIILICFKGHASQPVLAVVMNFDCPHCRSVFQSRNLLDSQCGGGLNTSKCRLAYISFPSGVTDYRSMAFYIAKNISEELALDVADIFYSYDPKGILSKDEVTTLLETLAPSTNWEDLFNGPSEEKGRQSLFKAAELLRVMRITDYPSFLWITETDARVIPTVQNPKKRLDSVINYLGKIL
jgi:hypothetical protein